jgi:hypothetical protein
MGIDEMRGLQHFHRGGVPRIVCVIFAGILAGCGSSEIVSSGDPAVTLRTAVLQKLQAPATKSAADPNAVSCLTVERAVEEALVASPELDQIAARTSGGELVGRPSQLLPAAGPVEYNTTDNPVYE